MLLSLQYLSVIGLTLAGVTGIILSIIAFRKNKAQRLHWDKKSQSKSANANMIQDEIIAVRKKEETYFNSDASVDSMTPPVMTTTTSIENSESTPQEIPKIKPPVQVLRVMAQKNAPFSGYELLQALLSADFRFGKMNIFHYHHPETDEILFSLASAVEPGTFDMLNMGAFTCPGLTLFMKTRHTDADDDIYQMMHTAAQHLTEDLHGVLLETAQ